MNPMEASVTFNVEQMLFTKYVSNREKTGLSHILNKSWFTDQWPGLTECLLRLLLAGCVCVLPHLFSIHVMNQLVSLVDQRHQLLDQQLLSLCMCLRLLALCKVAEKHVSPLKTRIILHIHSSVDDYCWNFFKSWQKQRQHKCFFVFLFSVEG